MKKWQKRTLFVVLVGYSIITLLFSPFEPLLEEVKSSLPWVLSGILLSEVILTVGLVGMGSLAGLVTWKEVLAARKAIKDADWKGELAYKLRYSRPFWVFFWISVVGGVGDGLVLIAGIGSSMPIASWGLMLIPFSDLLLTYGIRKMIYTSVRTKAALVV